MIAGRSAARRGIRAKHSALRKEHEHKKKVQLEQAKIWFQQHVSGNWNPAHHRAAAKLELLRLALRRFDTDKSGVLSRDQLAKLLEHVAAVPPSEELRTSCIKPKVTHTCQTIVDEASSQFSGSTMWATNS